MKCEQPRKQKQGKRGDGTTCELSKEHPCFNRAYKLVMLRDDLRLYLCDDCIRQLRLLRVDAPVQTVW